MKDLNVEEGLFCRFLRLRAGWEEEMRRGYGKVGVELRMRMGREA